MAPSGPLRASSIGHWVKNVKKIAYKNTLRLANSGGWRREKLGMKFTLLKNEIQLVTRRGGSFILLGRFCVFCAKRVPRKLSIIPLYFLGEEYERADSRNWKEQK